MEIYMATTGQGDFSGAALEQRPAGIRVYHAVDLSPLERADALVKAADALLDRDLGDQLAWLHDVLNFENESVALVNQPMQRVRPAFLSNFVTLVLSSCRTEMRGLAREALLHQRLSEVEGALSRCERYVEGPLKDTMLARQNLLNMKGKGTSDLSTCIDALKGRDIVAATISGAAPGSRP